MALFSRVFSLRNMTRFSTVLFSNEASSLGRKSLEFNLRDIKAANKTKKFYKSVEVMEAALHSEATTTLLEMALHAGVQSPKEAGYVYGVTLDNRIIKTPSDSVLAVPSLVLEKIDCSWLLYRR